MLHRAPTYDQHKNKSPVKENIHPPDRPLTRYMPGLDGLRALALLAVMAYHWQFGFASGGFLGVSLFFVLSGYLITDILAAQWHHSRTLNLKDFWMRRIRRLMPAMLFTLFMTVVWVTLFDPVRLPELRNDVLGAVTYISNWQFIWEQKSYFESFGPPSPLGHFWSLAVEEQFYLLWPILMVIGLRFFPRRGQLFILIMTGAALSAFAMAALYVPGTDPSRVYFGTDTRAFGLLIGAALALVWPSSKLSSASTSRRSSRLLNLVGGLALLIVLFMLWKTDRYDPLLYQGGMLGFSVAAAVLVAAIAHPTSMWSRLLSLKPLRWIGVRSYGIYLWHYPVMILTSPPAGPGQLSAVEIGLQIIASIVLAALTYTYVEEPIRRGRLQSLWNNVRQRKPRSIFLTLRGSMASLGLIGLLAIFCFGIMTSAHTVKTGGDMAAWLEMTNPEGSQPAGAVNGSDTTKGHINNTHPQQAQGESDDRNADGKLDISGEKPESPPSSIDERSDETSATGNPDKDSEEGAGSGDPAPGKARPTDSDETGQQSEPGSPGDTNSQDLPPSGGEKSPSSTQPSDAPSSDPSGSGDAGDSPSGEGKSRPQQGEPPRAGHETGSPAAAISAIGDSVMLGVTPYLEQSLPGINIDAEIGRQLRQAESLLPQLAQWGRIDGGVVIIALGTNGAFSPQELDSLLASLSTAKQIILVNIRVPRDWEQQVNRMLAQAAADYPNVSLADWHSASKGHPEYFYEDGVHLRPEGAKAYTALLIQTIKP